MNAAVLMETCPSDETLAAFIDDRLDEKSRLQVLEHAANCGDCRDIVVAGTDYAASSGADTPKVAPGRFGRRLVPLAVAAAVLAVVFGVTPIREKLLGTNGMTELVKAANSLPERAIDARLSGDFAYKKRKPIYRSAEAPEDAEPAVLAAALKIAERAEKNRSPKNLHELGVANILIKDADASVHALEEAARTSTVPPDVLTDLAAAYLTRNRDGDAQRAFDAATKAWTLKQTPAAAWNRALALERLERKPEAIAAWRKYLELDPASEWSKEAARRIETLQEY